MMLRTFFVTSVFLLSSLSLSAEVVNLSCNQIGSDAYTVTYTMTGDTHAVQIFSSRDATGNGAMQLLSSTRDTHVTLHAGKAGERIYFFVKPDVGGMREVSIRHLPLEGTPNFRDLGGYETGDGRYTKWGLMYRSGVLSTLTPADLTYLSGLGVRVVCDFRTDQENAAAPERYVDDASVQRVHLPIGTDSSGNVQASLQRMLATNPDPAQLHQWLADSYGHFAVDAAPQYAKVFEGMKEDRLPLLYHCSAGKDRTGVFSALLLKILGVPEKTIYEDYALTNQYLSASSLGQMKSVGTGLKFTPEQAKALIAADPDTLRAAFRAIDQKYGSFDQYRKDALHLTDDDVERLKARLLTQ